MIIGEKDYRDILKQEFQRRVDTNPSYSLRSYARDLGVSPGGLSEILKARLGVSVSSAKKMAKALRLDQNESDYFCDLVESVHARSKLKKQLAQARLKKYSFQSFSALQMDALEIISNWYYFAILELTYIEGFKSDATWVAKQLNLTTVQVECAVEKLIKVGLLEIKEGKWIDTESFLATPDGVSSRAIRRLHSQLLDKAKHSLDNQSVDDRDSTAMIMAFNKENIPKAKDMIKKFRRRFLKTFEESEQKDAVYSLNINFFALNEGEDDA